MTATIDITTQNKIASQKKGPPFGEADSVYVGGKYIKSVQLWSISICESPLIHGAISLRKNTPELKKV